MAETVGLTPIPIPVSMTALAHTSVVQRKRKRTAKPPTRRQMLLAAFSAWSTTRQWSTLLSAAVSVGILCALLHVPAGAVNGLFAVALVVWPLVWLSAESHQEKRLLYPLVGCGVLAGFWLTFFFV